MEGLSDGILDDPELPLAQWEELILKFVNSMAKSLLELPDALPSLRSVSVSNYRC